MNPQAAFDIALRGYAVHRLSPEDSRSIQTLYDRCLDYMLLVDGHPAGPDAGRDEFRDVPPGKTTDDKYLFGIFDQQDELIGLLDTMRGYPDESTWWIGLLLFAPEARSQGIGQKVVEGFVEYVRVRKGRWIMLGVVEENEPAYRFWMRVGFEWVRTTEPRQFGVKTHRVNILRQGILEAH